MKLPKQHNIPYLGGIWTLAGYVAFFYSCLNTFWIIIIAYSSTEEIRNVFQSYLLFFACNIFIGFLFLVFCYKYVIPSTITFQQVQSVIDKRNPIYEKVCEIERKLDELIK